MQDPVKVLTCAPMIVKVDVLAEVAVIGTLIETFTGTLTDEEVIETVLIGTPLQRAVVEVATIRTQPICRLDFNVKRKCKRDTSETSSKREFLLMATTSTDLVLISETIRPSKQVDVEVMEPIVSKLKRAPQECRLHFLQLEMANSKNHNTVIITKLKSIILG